MIENKHKMRGSTYLAEAQLICGSRSVTLCYLTILSAEVCGSTHTFITKVINSARPYGWGCALWRNF